jgi:hypothetical protein
MTRPHPSQAASWEWWEGDEDELHEHRITPNEVYDVWINGPQFARNKRRRTGDWKMMGRTDGGRKLTIVLRYYAGRRSVRPITGWESTDGEITRYFKESEKRR